MTPNPNRFAGVVFSPALTGVSCASETACITVGPYFDANDVPVALAEYWDGVRWAAQAAPNPRGISPDEFGSFYAVSCVSRQTCTAVGVYRAKANIDHTLTEQWNGARWHVQRSATLPSTQASASPILEGISCQSATSCIAVGTRDAGQRPGTRRAMERARLDSPARRRPPPKLLLRRRIVRRVLCIGQDVHGCRALLR